jgi:SagB-type dehydrogenase family enzyme
LEEPVSTAATGVPSPPPADMPHQAMPEYAVAADSTVESAPGSAPSAGRSTRADASAGALRFGEGIAISVRDGKVIIDNSRTGASNAFGPADIPILELFLDWVEPQDVVDWAMTKDGEPGTIDRAVAVLRDLLSADDLISRREDLTGERLPSPGAGWAEAMRFLLATRTDRSTVFLAPQEFNAALAEKAFISPQASAFLEYSDAPYQPLRPPRQTPQEGEPAFAEVMLARRTARRYSDRPLTADHLSTLLYFGWGMTRSVANPLGDVFVRKTSPSGGSLHPVEAYPIVLNVEGVDPGCYHYSVRRHGLERLWEGDARDWIAFACGDQKWVAEAAVVVLCTAFLPRTAWKYDFSRVARAVMSEIGFTGQSALLTAAWLGLGGFTTIALRDEVFEKLIGSDPLRQPVFSVVGMGHLEPGLDDHSRPRDEAATEVEGG